MAPQILPDHLNLSQPEGHIMPTTLLLPPQPPGFSDLPTALHVKGLIDDPT